MKLEGRLNTVAERIKIDQNLDRLQCWSKIPQIQPCEILKQPKEEKELAVLTDCKLNTIQTMTSIENGDVARDGRHIM